MISQTNPLYIKADCMAKEVYKLTQQFPKHELYGIISQIRRASLSVILNIIEGFAREGQNEWKRFLTISYGSLKETMYLISFAEEQTYMTTEQSKTLHAYADEVGKILWTILHNKK